MLFLGIKPQKDTPLYNEEYNVLNYVHCGFINNSQKLKSTSMSFNKIMDKQNVIHLHNAV